MKASHLMTNALRAIANICLGNVAMVIGATATAVTTTGTPAFLLDGVARTLSAFTNTALSALAAADLPSAQANYLQPAGIAGFYTQPANTTVYYVFGVNAAGTLKVVQGLYQGQAIAAGLSVVGDGTVPDVPDGFIPIAVMKLASGGSAFIPGTTALTGLATFTNVGVLPVSDRP